MRHDPTDRSTQRGRLLALLVRARSTEVSLPEILNLKISQFGARIKELKAMGFKITNRQESRDGQRHSFYRLESGPTVPPPAPKSEPPEQSKLFGDLTPTRYPD
jgi:hypothetical protein